MAIRIIAIGKKHESWVEVGIERYSKRLRKPFDVEWVYLPHSSREGDQAREEESERIRKRVGVDDYILLLDERGRLHDSTSLSGLITNGFDNKAKVTVVIGGAYGVDDGLRDRADETVSLSRLVFPHQLVRLILIEQIYRSQEISSGNPYHHD